MPGILFPQLMNVIKIPLEFWVLGSCVLLTVLSLFNDDAEEEVSGAVKSPFFAAVTTTYCSPPRLSFSNEATLATLASFACFFIVIQTIITNSFTAFEDGDDKLKITFLKKKLKTKFIYVINSLLLFSTYTPLGIARAEHDFIKSRKEKHFKKIPYNVTITNESIELLLCTIIKYTRRNTDQMNSAFRKS